MDSMRFEDKNQTLVPPKDYVFRNAETDGAYMKLTYFQSVYKPATTTIIGENVATVYLNDQGREVGRCIGSARWPVETPVIVAAPRKFRFKNGFLLALHGIGEMLKCLK
jgi:hypothetical protein